MINGFFVITLKGARTSKGEASLFKLTLGQNFPPLDLLSKETHSSKQQEVPEDLNRG